MKRPLKILLWIFSGIFGLLILLVVSSPLLIMLGKEYKFENFASFHPKSEQYYSSEIQGAQPLVGCGGTAGKYGWGESTRRYVSLNGEWQVEQGGLSEVPPASFGHKAQVPGLLNAATPAFEDIGRESEERDAFWYKHEFAAPEQPSSTVLLCIAKVKYGARVWLNGVLLGTHYGAFTQAEFPIGEAIKWGESNELVVRVGAERSQLPPFIPAGQDQEKESWIPGIWDDVNLIFTGEQTVVRVKVETDIDSGLATVHTTFRNNGDVDAEISLNQVIKAWKGYEQPLGQAEVSAESEPILVEAGKTVTVIQELNLADFQLWTLGDPFLYVLNTELTNNGELVDDRATRFGYRSVVWKSGDEKGFYLNGDKTYLRGSNFSLHRFFEDPGAGLLAWNEEWVRQLYTSYPKKYHWNVFRTSLGRMPNFWYDIADEEGFLIDDEFAYWSLIFPAKKGSHGDSAHLEWSIIELEKEFTSWIQENWNHASIAWWSASNETPDIKSTEVIERVRQLDSTRQWENGGWQKPHHEDDPIEDHPYIFSANFNPLMALFGSSAEGIEALDEHDGKPKSPMNLMSVTYPSWSHSHIINEYGWLWLNRDASTTKLTEEVYAKLLGEDSTPEARREAWAYLHAGLTGFWRSGRAYAGVQHFCYLGHSKPGTAYTSDNFIDLENLVMEPRWHEYHKNVWSPVAVYIDQWEDNYKRGKRQKIPLVLINDLHTLASGTLELIVIDEKGVELGRSDLTPVELLPLDRQTLKLSVEIPDTSSFAIFARLKSNAPGEFDMWDRRKVGFEHPGVLIADGPRENK